MTIKTDDTGAKLFLCKLTELLFGPHEKFLVFKRDPGISTVDELFAVEAHTIAIAVPKRRRELHSGRALARQAFQSFGFPRLPLPRGLDGLPEWPAGFIGSISHNEEELIVAIGKCRDFLSLGVDVETARPLERSILGIVSSNEDRISSELKDQPWLPNLIFSAKEAFYKAQYPQFKVWLDFSDVAIDVSCLSPRIDFGEFSIRATTNNFPYPIYCSRICGRWAKISDSIYCSAIVRHAVPSLTMAL